MMDVWHEDDLPNKPMTLRTIVLACLGSLFAAVGTIGLGVAVWLVIAEMVG